MKFVIEHLSKKFEKKEVLRNIDFPLKRGRSMVCWAETAPARPRCSTA